VEEAEAAMVSVRGVAEEPVVAMVSTPNADISIIARNVYYDTGPGDSLKPILFCAAYYKTLAL
jgi:hypothetical protein